MRFKRSELFFVGIALVLFAILIPLSLAKYGDRLSVADDGEFYLCAQYLKEGTIFQGQPYCGQGIILYAFVLFLRLFTLGAFSKIFYLTLFVLLHVHALFLIHRIAKQETGKNEYLLVGILYLFTTYFFGGNLSSFLAMYFLLTGFYTLYYSSLPHKNILGPVLMTFGPLSKATAMPLFGFLVAYLAYRSFAPKLVNRRLVFNKDLRALIPFACIAAVFGLLFLFYPGAWVYEFGNQSARLTMGVVQTLQLLWSSFTINSGTVLFSTMFALAAIAWIFMRDVFSSAAVFSFAALFYILFGQTGLATDAGLQFAINRIDYYLPAYPFFIVALAKLKHRLRIKPLLLVYAVLLGLFLTTSAEFVVSEHDVRSLETSFKQALKLIPPQNDVALVEDSLTGSTLLADYYSKDIKIDVVPHDKYWKDTVFPDGNFINQLEAMNITRRDDWKIPTPQEAFTPYFQKLQNGAYSLILIGPPQWNLITFLAQNSPVISTYCVVRLPDLQFRSTDGVHELTLAFKDRSRCAKMIPSIKSYFEQSYARICRKSPSIANGIVRASFLPQGITLPECTGTADSLTFFNRKTYHFRIFSLALAVLLTWLAWLNGSVPRLRFSRRGPRPAASGTNP